ncbi:MAG: hypothetical protein COB30_003615 [Ectothiorhodospiraceae bacterium]|nr:hypothetical protein [Ectothiorhodospiraceae bacterium]
MQRPINQDELSVFYNAVGEAVWQIQYLEHALVNFVVIKRHKRKPTTEKKAYERLEKERKGTLGSIYGRAKDEGIIPKALESRFDNFIEERNWLIHDSRTSNSEDLYNVTKTEIIINRIHSIIEESIELTRVVLQLLKEFMTSEGFDLEEAYKRADGYIRGLEGRCFSR